MKYIIERISENFKPDGNWNKKQFAEIEAIKLNNFMGEKPEHFPQVKAKLVYNDKFLYVIFRVDDNYVKAVNTEYDSPVCRDSCVEFFFTPSKDIGQGYFNAEINCCGTLLLRHQKSRGIEQMTINPADAKKIDIFSTFKGKVEPEITQPTEWLIEYKISYEILKKYAPFTKPAAGVQWRGNFYKCADNTSKPHWLTWNKVELPKPDFHRPEFFGILEFK
jgi:hypothetical protein